MDPLIYDADLTPNPSTSTDLSMDSEYATILDDDFGDIDGWKWRKSRGRKVRRVGRPRASVRSFRPSKKKFAKRKTRGRAIPKRVGYKRKRRMTPGERKMSRLIKKAKVKSRVRSLQRKRPRVYVSRRGLKRIKKRRPIKYASVKRAYKRGVRKNMIARLTKARLRKSKRQAAGAMRVLKKELAVAVKTGAITPKRAKNIMVRKGSEVRARYRLAKRAALVNARAQLKRAKMSQLKTLRKRQVVRSRGYDKMLRKAEHEKRKIQGLVKMRKMKAHMARPIIAALNRRIRYLEARKKGLRTSGQIRKVNFLAKQGLINPQKAKRLQRNLAVQAARQKRKRDARPKIMNIKAQAFNLLKWIQAYEAAIAQAKQVGANFAIIPIDRLGKRNKVIKEFRMPLRNAQVKLARMKMQYQRLGKMIVRLGDKKVPTYIVAVDQRGKPISPETVKAQVKFIQRQIAAKKLDPIRGGEAIKHLRQVEQSLYKPRPPKKMKVKVKTIVVPVSKKTIQKAMPAGEKVAITKGGPAMTPKMAIPTSIPSAIPHKVAKSKTAVSSARINMVKMLTTPSKRKLIIAVIREGGTGVGTTQMQKLITKGHLKKSEAAGLWVEAFPNTTNPFAAAPVQQPGFFQSIFGPPAQPSAQQVATVKQGGSIVDMLFPTQKVPQKTVVIRKAAPLKGKEAPAAQAHLIPDAKKAFTDVFGKGGVF